MKLFFATKRDKSGNRYFLGIDTQKKEYSEQCATWYGVEDLTAQISKKERRALINKLDKEEYKEILKISLY